MASSLATSLTLGLLATIVGACASEEPSDPVLDVAQQPIIGGGDSTDAENFVVELGGVESGRFSGVLVTPTLVLTVRHGVTRDSAGGTFDCALGTEVTPPERILAYVGRDRNNFRIVKVKRIIVDLDSTACEPDIAAVELAEPVLGLAYPPIRLDTVPPDGDRITTIGWGIADDATGGAPVRRQRQEGLLLGTDGAGTYTSQGKPAAVSYPPGSKVVATNVATCGGDSGGAVLDSTGALIGVNAFSLIVDSEANICAGASSVATSMFEYAAFVERAHRAIGVMPVRAGEAPPGELGAACQRSNQCNSNLCVTAGSRGSCSKVCQTDGDCGGPLVCTETGAQESGGQPVRVCLDQPTAPVPEGCSSSGSTPTSPWGSVLLGLAVAGLWTRRTSQRRKITEL